ncbi:hypothetical protein ABMA27_002894 [Loxostege sticticalis]|uniref:Odorant receptor n=1 Tax=Loxostege sticticalis TaxID=481309 RepID=A0ABR3HV99_LOXSC
MDLRYMKQLRNFLHLLDCWPHRLLGEDVKPFPLRSIRVLVTEWIIILVGGVIFLRANINERDFIELGQTYLTIFLTAFGIQRVTISLSKSYQELMNDFVLEIHLFHHRQKSKYSEYMYQHIHKICTVLVSLMYAEAIISSVLFNVTPLYKNYKKGMFSQERPSDKRFELSVYYSLPFVNQETNLFAYIVVSIFNVTLTFDCGLIYCGLDANLAIIVFHIWGHLKILDNTLRSIPTPVEMRNHIPRFDDKLSYTKEENEKVAAMLKYIIHHHRLIMGFMTKTSSAFGPTLCLYLLFHQISGCFLLLECSTMDAESLGRYAALTVIFFQLLIQICVIVELLGSQSETLKDAVYSIPWESMDTSNRKLVLFLLCNVQEPIRLKPMGMVSLGVQTMATVRAVLHYVRSEPVQINTDA